MFSATFREDASSRFATGNQWGFFPGASVGWVMSDESFMQNIKPIDNLKWRISYGQTGNNAIGLYDAMANIQQMPNTMELQELSRLLCLI